MTLDMFIVFRIRASSVFQSVLTRSDIELPSRKLEMLHISGYCHFIELHEQIVLNFVPYFLFRIYDHFDLFSKTFQEFLQ